MSKIPFVAVAALTSVMTASAFAADLPSRTFAPVAMPVPHSWSGCYVGVNAGGDWSNTEWTNNSNGQSENGPNIDGGGWLAGGQVGCNFQVNNWVLGAQVDEDWANVSGSDSTFEEFTSQVQTTSLGSATLRGGYAWDRLLVYLKGGFAWESNKYTESLNFEPLVLAGNRTQTGATVGFGAEYAFTQNLSGFLEYDYYDFGRNGVTLTGCANSCFTDNVRLRESSNVLKLGLNWKFDMFAPPPR